jgi:PIN domain
MESVFIDTSILRREDFRFDAALFRTLLTLAHQLRVTILTTDITVSEVHAQIDELIDAESGAIRKAATAGRMLTRFGSLTESALLLAADVDHARKRAHAHVDSFFAAPGVQTLKATDVQAGRIFKRYFEKRPPFGEGKKKSEFPDAFAAQAIVDWTLERSSSVIVVSGDADWAAYCEENPTLVYSDSLKETVARLLDLDDHAGVMRAITAIEPNLEALARAIIDEIPNLGAYLEDVEGETLGLSASDVSIDVFAVIEVDGAKATLAVGFTCDVDFEVHYDDPQSWIYDSEEKTVHYMNSIDTTITNTMSLEAEVEIDLDKFDSMGDADKHLAFSVLTVNKGRDIGVTVQDYE